jgi:hypothetical protein
VSYDQRMVTLNVAHTWGTTAEERALAFPGDRDERPAWQSLFRGVSIAAPAVLAFRWLCQLRAAPYSYDWIDNRGRQSPRTLTPSLEQLAVGQTVMEIFRLESFEEPVHLTLATPAGGRGERLFGPMRCTYWVRPANGNVRLLVKLRLAPTQGSLSRLAKAALAWGDLVMMRRQLLNLKALAESK